MISLVYPYLTYKPNPVAAACASVIVGISLIAWLVQSYQNRFHPTRLSALLLVSHITIYLELILRAAVTGDERNSRSFFSITGSLLTVGQRMIIMGNFVFVMEVRREKSRRARAILLGTMIGVVSSALLTLPANLLSFDSDTIGSSYVLREVSASLLLVVTLSFYLVWYWSKTIGDMSRSAVLLISVSSVACVMLSMYTLIQSLPKYYDRINAHEGWFYGFQMLPIILAHCTWTILHPKRSLLSSESLLSTTEE